MNDKLDELRCSMKDCKDCSLCKTRGNIVFGVGNENADVMLIGEAPGAQEDAQGEPFVGRSGQLMDKMLECVDLSRSTNIYIANMIKCRPPENRDPSPEEQDACSQYLARQIEIINPKIIVCVGRIAAKRFISDKFKVTAEHGIWYENDGRLVMGIFHPSALLRNPNLKPTAFEDFVKLRDKMKELGCLL